MSDDKGHPLPASDEARHDEIPEGIEQRKGQGDDDPKVADKKPEASQASYGNSEDRSGQDRG